MKFRLREKLKYMLLGGLLPLAGFMLGNINNNTEAQFGSETIDELTIQKLNVVEEITLYNGSEPQVFIRNEENGGAVTVYGKGGKGVAHMGIDENGGDVIIVAKEGNGGVSITTDENMDGSLQVFAKGNKLGVKLAIIDDGGLVRAKAKTGEGSVNLTVVDSDGVILVTDKFGEISELPTK